MPVHSGNFCPAVKIVFSQGLVCCLLDRFALQDPTRVWFVVCVPHFLSLFGILADAVLRFSSFFLSGTGETQTFVVWVSPCVSSSRPRSRTSTRTSCSTSASRSGSRACFFFYDVVRLSDGGWSRSVWGVLGLQSCFCCGGVYACTYNESLEEMARMFRWGSQTIIWRPNYHHCCCFGYARDGNCTVTLVLLDGSPFPKGEMLSVFCFVLARCPLSLYQFSSS